MSQKSVRHLPLALLALSLVLGLAILAHGSGGFASAAVTADGVAEIAWERIHGGTLDGVHYDDLYWGGIATSRLDLVDIDADGDLDVFLAGQNRRQQNMEELHFFRNDGSPTEPRWMHVTDRYFPELGWASNRPSFVDLDTDGDYDCVLDGGPGFIYYENTGTPENAAWMLRSIDMLASGRSESQAFGDLDGDDDLDLLHMVATEAGGEWTVTLAHYENTGTPTVPAWTWRTDAYAEITSTVGIHPTLADIDADGDLDLFVGRPEQILFYRNDGNASAPVWTFITNTYGGIQYGAGMMHFQVAFGDLDGNNTLDMMIGHELGWVTSYRNTGTIYNASWTLWQDGLFPMNYGQTANPALADIDDDDDLDLFLGMGDPGVGDSDGLVFLRNLGTTAETSWTYVTGSYGGIVCDGEKFPTFVDIDADNDLDLFIGIGPFFGSQEGTLRFYRNTGSPTNAGFTLESATYLGIVAPYYSRVVPTFTDIDGDGDQDLFVAVEGQIHHYLNSGTPTSPSWTHITDTYAGVYALYLAFADVDGDGDQDLFTHDAFYRNDGDTSSASWAAPLSPDGIAWAGGSLALGDLLDADSRPELLLGGNGGVHLYRNLGDLPPHVASVAPAAGGSGLPASAIIATFDNSMDPATMGAGSVLVEGSVSGAVTIALTYLDQSRQLVIKPQELLVEGETVDVTLRASITDSAGNALDGDVDGTAEGSPSDDYGWSFTIHDRDELVVVLLQEPGTLYPYDASDIQSLAVLSALYDGPIHTHSYGYQPVILAKLPTIEDGDAQISAVTVSAGATVVNASNEVVTLTVGTLVLPAGCRSSDCAVTFTGAPLQMDQLQATFQLLPDIRWSDGTALTADDSLYSYEIHQAEPWLYSARNMEPSSQTLAFTASYEQLDSLRTRWTGLPGFIDSRYSTFFWHPLPRHAWKHLTPAQLHTAPESTQAPLGWGPYAISAWEPGVAITLTVNPYYYRAAEGLPKIDTLVFHFANGQVDWGLMQVAAGQADATDAWFTVYDQFALLELARIGAVNALVEPGIVWEHADFAVNPVDTYIRPDFFENREMRRAIAYCLDRDQIANEATAGYSYRIDAYIPPEHPLYPESGFLTLYPHNVLSGTLLLEGLGWRDTNGDGIRECRSCTTPDALEGDLLRFSWKSTNATFRIIYTQAAAANLAECGIDLVIENVPAFELYASGPDGPVFGLQYDMASFGWLAEREPPCALYTSGQIPSDTAGWAGQNNTGWSNPAYDAACELALRSLPGSAAFVAGHQEAMRILSEELPMIPLFQRVNMAATNPRLLGPVLDPDAYNFFDNIEAWAFLADAVPPEGTLQAGDGSQSQTITPVTLHLSATDSGGTVTQMLIRERTWNGSDWAVVAETGWIPYAASYGWDLDPTPAAHYLSAYFMDDSGNISLLPAQTIVNLTPASASILAGEIVVYRVRVEESEAFSASLTTYSGDADLHIWAPGSGGEPDFYSNLDGTAVDQVTVALTAAGDYHIEVRGYAVASAYRLVITAPTLQSAATAGAAALSAKELPAAPLTVIVPDAAIAEVPGGLPAVMELRAPRLTLTQSGDSVAVTAEVWDQKGQTVPDGTLITFATTLGTFEESGTSATTAVTAGGLARVTLRQGNTAGTAQVAAQSGDAQALLNINFVVSHRVYLAIMLRDG